MAQRRGRPAKKKENVVLPKHTGLERLLDIPLDVVREIARHLFPTDLLHLSRTNRTLRRFILARDAAPLWRTAQLNVPGLPECPGDMGEPEYAHLIFDRFCHKCLDTGPTSIYWAFGKRYCQICKRTMLVKFARCENDEKCFFQVGASCDEAAIPYVRDPVSGAHLHYAPEVMKFKLKIRNMRDFTRERLMYQTRQIMDHAARCESWLAEQTNLRSRELEDGRAQRLDSIINKLKDLGWNDELNAMKPFYDQLSEHPDVRKAAPLTNKDWVSMQERIIEFTGKCKESHLKSERIDVLTHRCELFAAQYRAWWAKQSDRASLPRAIELLHRAEVRALIEQPNTAHVSAENFAPLVEHFPAWVAAWRAEKDDVLREIVRASPAFAGKLEDDVDPLTLASVAFDCTLCHGDTLSTQLIPPLYPSILSHACLYARTTLRDARLADDPFDVAVRWATPAPAYEDDEEPECYERWDAEGLCIGVWCVRAAEMVKACGKDPWSTTRAEMDELEVRLWCLPCNKRYGKRRRQVMQWRYGFKHYLRHDVKNRFGEPTYIPALELDEEVPQAKEENGDVKIEAEEETIKLEEEVGENTVGDGEAGQEPVMKEEADEPVVKQEDWNDSEPLENDLEADDDSEIKQEDSDNDSMLASEDVYSSDEDISWDEVYDFNGKTQDGLYPIGWRVVSKKDQMDVVYDVEGGAYGDAFEEDEEFSEAPWYMCTHCSAAPLMSESDVKTHLGQEHGIKNVLRGEAYASNIYRTADADLAMARPIWLMDWKYVERMCDAQEDIIKTSKGHFCDLD